MKKQILFLIFLVLASFASVNNAFAQYDPNLTAAPTGCPTPTPIEATCVTSGPLSPVAGTSYTYTVTVNDLGTIHWLVTTESDFIVAGMLTSNIETTTGGIISAAGTAYNDPANTSATVDITWRSFDPAQNVFLVTYVENSAGCTDNIQVYKIVPVHAFTLDIVALTQGGAPNTNPEDCVSPVFGASWNGTNVTMDYGVNYVYFAVTAANWSHSWLPSFQLTATNMGTTGTLAVDWAYDNLSYGASAVWNGTTVSGDIYTSTNAVTPSNEVGVDAAGECIIVRVTVDHNQDETLAAIVLNLGVDGVMYDPSTTAYGTLTLGDLHWTAGSEAGQGCPWVDGYVNDNVDYTLTPRPTVTSATPTSPTDPTPLPFLIKN